MKKIQHSVTCRTLLNCNVHNATEYCAIFSSTPQQLSQHSSTCRVCSQSMPNVRKITQISLDGYIHTCTQTTSCMNYYNFLSQVLENAQHTTWSKKCEKVSHLFDKIKTIAAKTGRKKVQQKSQNKDLANLQNDI